MRDGDELLPGFADLLRRVRAGLTTFEQGAVELAALEEAEHRRVMDRISAGLRQIADVLERRGIQWRTRKDAGNMAVEPSLLTTLQHLDDVASSDDETHILARDAAAAIRHLERTLRRLADASEAAASSDPDMPSHESTVAEFDEALDAAREVLQS